MSWIVRSAGQQLLGSALHVPFDRLTEGFAGDRGVDPVARRRRDAGLPRRGEEVPHGLVGHEVRQGGGPLRHGFLEGRRVQVGLDPRGGVVQHFLQDGVDLLPHLGSQEFDDGAALHLQNLVEEAGQPLVEGLAELGPAEDPRQILLGQEPGAHGASDRRREPAPVSGDGPVQEADAPSRERRRAVRVEEHPDRQGVGEPARQGAGGDGDHRLEDRLVHSVDPRRGARGKSPPGFRPATYPGRTVHRTPVIAGSGAGIPSRPPASRRW